MKKIALFALIALFLGSCNNSADDQAGNTEDTQILISLEDFYSQPDDYIGKEVTIEGLVTHVCKHGGQKLFITGTEGGEALRIDVGENIPEFDISMEGSKARFTGKVELMDEEFMAQAQAEHEMHHGDEGEGEGEGDNIHAMKEKNFHIVAQNFTLSE